MKQAIPIIVLLSARSFSCLQTAPSDPALCERLILGDMFPSCYLAFYTAVRLFFNAVPRSVLEQHTLTLRRVATLDISKGQFAECIGYMVTVLCVLFCILNSKKDYSRPPQSHITYLWIAGILGGVSIFLVFGWKCYRIFMELRRLDQGEDGDNNSVRGA